MKKAEAAIPNVLLRDEREKHHWTQEELAERLGTTSISISRWESGITLPSRHFRKKLCDLFGKSEHELQLRVVAPLAGARPTAEQESETGDHEGPHPSSTPPLRHVVSAFVFNEPLSEPGELYGRRRERETLMSRTCRKASTSIIGPRRIGKTWLVDYLRLVAPVELGHRFRVGYLDATMSSCGTIAGFTREALDALGLPVSDDPRGPNHHRSAPAPTLYSHVHEGLIDLEKGLKALKSKNNVPVLCIDEFEGLSNRQEFTLDFFRALRAMAHMFRLVLVVVSKQPLSVVVGKDVETSGFFNIFEQLTLKPFHIEEAREFIETKGVQAGFSPQEQDLLWHYGQEHEQEWPPLRLQLVGKLLLEEREHVGYTGHNHTQFEQQLREKYREVMY